MKKAPTIFFLIISFMVIFTTANIFAESEPSTTGLEDDLSFENEIVNDPLEPYNRLITAFNDKMYFWLLEPTSSGYATVTPEKPRTWIDNFFRNITFPIRFVNSLLQFKIEKAGIVTARFLINSTLGIAGFSDTAKVWFDIDPENEDFGQTLGFYHIGSIMHIDWPFIGPLNLRDTIGYIGDFFLNPINYLPSTWLITGVHVFEKINHTSLHLGEYEQLKKESVDYYLQIRDSYEQYRIKEIKE